MTFLRVALIGCGLISEEHIRAYAAHADRAQITVCYDINRERAEQCAVLAGGAKVAATLAEVFADPNVDAVELCTPPHLHPESVIAAAQSGKHVLCQKPLARTVAECNAMIAAARDAGTVLFYGETNRTLPAAMEARRVIDSGRIGRLVGLQATFAYWQGGALLTTPWRYDPAIAGGGQLLDSGIHSLALMHVFGGPVASVSCFTQRFRPELGGDDTSSVTLQFQGGHLGTLFSSQSVGAWVPAPLFTVYGTEGALTLGGTLGTLVLHRHDLPDRRETLIADWENPFIAMIGRYLDTVLNGAENPSPGEAGREDLSVVLAAYQSAEQGRQIPLAEFLADVSP